MVTKKTIDGLNVGSVVKNTTPKKLAKVKPAQVEHKISVKKTEVKMKAKAPEKESVETSKQTREDFLEQPKPFDMEISSEELKDEIKKKKKETKKCSKARKIILFVIFGILFVLVGGMIWLSVWGNDLIAKMTGGNSNIWEAIDSVLSEKYEPLKVGENKRTNILIFGTSGYDMSGSTGKGKHDGSQLTDSIMIFSFDQETGDMAMISLPRDLKAGSTCTATGKINEVYWCNNMKGSNEAGGAKALQEKVGGILGIDFQYYVHLNWGSLVTVVDSIGGITVTLDENINDKNWTGTVIKAGVPTTLNGEQALGLARARHGTSGGDFTRGNSQQKILIAIKDKILENGIGIIEGINLLNVLGDNVRSDFTIDEIKSGINFIQTHDLSQMRQVSLRDLMMTANINGISYVIPRAGADNYSAIRKSIEANVNSDPLVREAAKILILNGSGESGLAAKEKTALETDNYTVAEIKNVPDGTIYPDPYYLYDLSEDKPVTVASLENKYGVEAHSKDELPEGISRTEYDIVIIMGIPEKDTK